MKSRFYDVKEEVIDQVFFNIVVRRGIISKEEKQTSENSLTSILESRIETKEGIVIHSFPKQHIAAQFFSMTSALITSDSNDVAILLNKNGDYIQIVDAYALNLDSDDKEAYKLTEWLKEHKLIVLRINGLEYLYDLNTGARLSIGFNAINEENGKIIAEMRADNQNYQEELICQLMGELDLNGHLVNGIMFDGLFFQYSVDEEHIHSDKNNDEYGLKRTIINKTVR